MRRRPKRPDKEPQSPARESSISADGDISGIASTGAYTTNVQAEQATVLPAHSLRPVSEVAAPPGLMNLPTRPHLFVGRDEQLAGLHASLTAATVRAVVVHGLGGIGKSTLAARYAATHEAEYSLVWWISADAPSTIDAGLAALAVALQPELSRAFPLEALRERALQWLAFHDRWLLVLDNANDPKDIAPLTGRVDAGRLLITSRLATGWHAVTSAVVPLDVLSHGNAVDLLTKIAPRQADGAAELCTELGCLPLAIEQAGAYLAETGISPRAYQALLAEYPAAMFDSVAVGGDTARTIARIWRVTLDRFAGTPLSGEILRILAWYAPDPIPRAILDGLADPPNVHRAIGRLSAYSMIAVGDDMTITVHRLVQAVSRTPDAADPHRAAARVDDARAQATTLLDSAAPPSFDDPAAWPTWRALLPHIDALADHALADTDSDTTAGLLIRTGGFLDNQGAPARAIRLLLRALAGAVRVLGEDHPNTLVSRNNLASAYESAGDLGQAISLYQQSLGDAVRVLGDDHPATLAFRNNLAYAYQAAGKLDQAIALYQQALADAVRVLGEDHRQTLGSRNNLAGAYQAAGKLNQAIPLHEQTLADRQRVLGEDHPDTLASRNNLAGAYRAAGDLGRAVPQYRQILIDRRRVLGEDHPDTLASGNNLAAAYQAAGELDRAIALYQQALADAVRVLGEDHRQTLALRTNLAGAYQAAGKLDQAIPLCQQALDDAVRVLGQDHPYTLALRTNLAGAYQAAGKLDQAIPLHEQTLADKRRLLGQTHPDTLTSRNNLAEAYATARKLDQAIPLHEQTLADRQRVLGEDHPDTLISRTNLAGAYQAAGKLDQAIPLHEQTLADKRRLLGQTHPSTLISRNNLASAYQAAGDLDKAIPVYQQTLTDAVRALGKNHPISVLILRNLTAARRQR